MKVSESQSVVSNPLGPRGPQPSRIFCPWNSPGQNTGVGCYFLLRGIFPTQGWNLHLLHCRQILYHLSAKVCDTTLAKEREQDISWDALRKGYPVQQRHKDKVSSWGWLCDGRRLGARADTLYSKGGGRHWLSYGIGRV